MDDAPAVRTDRLVKHYNGTVAVDDVTFTVPRAVAAATLPIFPKRDLGV